MTQLTKQEARAVKALVRRVADRYERYGAGGNHTIFNTDGVRPTQAMYLLQGKLISMAASKLGDEWDA